VRLRPTREPLDQTA